MLVSLAKLSEPEAAKAVETIAGSFTGAAHLGEWKLAVSALCEVAAAYCAPGTMLSAGDAVDKAFQKARPLDCCCFFDFCLFLNWIPLFSALNPHIDAFSWLCVSML